MYKEINFLYIVIIELADIAKVFSHVDTTVGAYLSYLNKTNIETNPKCHTRAYTDKRVIIINS